MDHLWLSLHLVKFVSFIQNLEEMQEVLSSATE